MRTFFRDVSYGLRLLRSSPGFAAVAILTLAVGIAANTTVFSWVDGLLWHPFGGATDSRQLAVLEMIEPQAPNGANQVSYLDYLDYRAKLKSLSGLAVHREDVFSLGDVAHSEAAWGELVSGNYFAVLGVKPALGRMFNPEEDSGKLGAFPVAVISHRLWRDRFHADRGAIGQTLRVNRHELTVIGVAPPEFHGTMPGLVYDIWIPVTMGVELGMLDESAFRYRWARRLYAVARLNRGVRMEEARAEAATLAANLAALSPQTNRGVSATILPVWRFHSAAPDLLLQPLRILMAISIFVLLIVCFNVANLLLARSLGRRKEFSIRLALGASPFRLSCQLLTETLMLAAAGALIALPLSFWAGDALPWLVPKIHAPVAIGFQMNYRVLGFTLLACVLAAMVSGAAPALLWFRSDANQALKENGRGASQGAYSLRLRGMLVVSEVALATLALVGAGLFSRSFENARAIHPGFDSNNVVLARFYLGSTGFSTRDMQQFGLRLRERLRADPGIASVSYADIAPLGSSAGPYSTIQVEGYVPGPDESMQINRYLVAPGYFNLLKIPLLEGRDFTDSEIGDTPPVMIVNQSFAERYFHGANPLGRRVRCFGKWLTVVGLAKDSKYFNVAEARRPHFFAPFLQWGRADQQLYFFLKAAHDPAPVMAGLHREVAEIDVNAGAFDVMPLAEWMGVTLLPQKVAASLLTALGAIALLLAAVGLYSVMAYAVTQRTQEIGIRMALGAQPHEVLTGILRQGITLTLAGLGIGIAASLAVTRVVAGMLVNVSAFDPMSFGGAAVFLIAVAMLASYVPARRATQVDPIVALRPE